MQVFEFQIVKNTSDAGPETGARDRVQAIREKCRKKCRRNADRTMPDKRRKHDFRFDMQRMHDHNYFEK